MMALVLISYVGAQSVFAGPDPCKAVAELEAAKKVALGADASLKALPGPDVKPAGEAADAAAAVKKAEGEAAVEEAAAKLADTARAVAQQAWAKHQAANGLTGFANAAAVQAELARVRERRSKAVAALGSVDKTARAAIVLIRAMDMRPLETRIRARMGGDPDAIEPQLDDVAAACNDAGVATANAALTAAREALATLDRKESKGLETAEDINGREARVKAITGAETAVAAAVGACKSAARADLKAWRIKRLEADSLEEKLFPDEATRSLVAELPALNARIGALEAASPVAARADKAVTAATQAKTKATAKQTAVTKARALQKAHGEWAPRAKLVDAKVAADAAVATKQTAIANEAAATTAAVAAAAADGTAAVARIKGAVAADLVRLTADIARETRALALAEKPGFVKRAADIKSANGRITPTEVAAIRSAWTTRKKELVSGARAKERTQHSARRRQAAAELATEIAKLAPYLCFDNVKKVEESMNTVRTEWLNSGLELVLPPNMALDLGELDLPEATTPRIVLTATFVEAIVNGEAAKAITETLAVTFDLGSGAVSGTFSGAGSGEIESACNSRLRYRYSHSGAVAGSVAPGGGQFTIAISPRGTSSASFVRKGDCDFRPAKTGPFAGKGAITGTVTPDGAVTLSSRWRVGDAGISGKWSGAGAASP